VAFSACFFIPHPGVQGRPLAATKKFVVTTACVDRGMVDDLIKKQRD